MVWLRTAVPDRPTSYTPAVTATESPRGTTSPQSNRPAPAARATSRASRSCAIGPPRRATRSRTRSPSTSRTSFQRLTASYSASWDSSPLKPGGAASRTANGATTYSPGSRPDPRNTRGRATTSGTKQPQTTSVSCQE